MPFQFGRYATEEEEDWEIIGGDWWHTSFEDVLWSYISKKDRADKKAQQPHYHGSLLYNQPSKQESLTLPVHRRRRSSVKERKSSDEDDALNVELVGVRAALEAVVAYEEDVGFHFAIDEKDLLVGKKRWDELLEELMNGPAFDNSTDSDESLESSFIGSISSSGELCHSTSTISSMTFSEGSIDSVGMPSTPKPKSSFNDIEIRDISPTGSVSGSVDYHTHLLSPTRSLNASASSFVPTFCSQLNDEPLRFASLRDKPKPAPDPSSPLASFANFTFPTLNAHPPPEIKIKKDEHGFVTEVQVECSLPSASGKDLLPPFLQEPSQRNRTRKSRTREIVDRLRSQATTVEDASAQLQQMSNISPKYASHSPSPIGDEVTFVTPRLSVSEDGGDRVSRLSTPSCEDDDGWIDISQPNATPPSRKSKRARELLLALTRRRTDSLTSENLRELMTSETSPRSSRSQDVSLSPSPSPLTPPLLVSNDGWIENSINVPPEPPKKAKVPVAQNSKESHNNSNNHNHNRKKSSNHASRTSTSSTSHSHPHPHPQQQQQPFSAPSSCYPHPLHSSSTVLPHMVSPQTIPYFFPPYPTVAMPVPYTAFMHMPNYRMGMPMHGGPMAPVNAAAHGMSIGSPVQYPVPQVLGMSGLPGASIKPSMTSGTTANMNTPPTFRAKHSPLW
ncbi:hypothetical protein BDZ97DRAFT_1919596 [Flammula alnicola]|nr:hypothetical protein BDZ97DRAFT_1919596 [Flammula alnicola]